jgi:amino acid transporter
MAESEKERLDRELIELLNELRVALPGVQVLFAFLLILPFTDKFETLTAFDHAVYFVALLLCAAASAFLIAPSAHHRLRFREGAKEELLQLGNRMAIAGLVCLALAIAASVSVVADFLYGERVRVPVTVAVLLGLGGLWFVVPNAVGRARRPNDGPSRD